MCAEQIPLEATVCEYCGTRFEVTVGDGRVESRMIEESVRQSVAAPAPALGASPLPAQPAPAPKQSSRRMWVGVGAGALLLIGLLGGGILLTQNGLPWLAAATQAPPLVATATPAPRPTAPRAPVATQTSGSSQASTTNLEIVDDFESVNTEMVWSEQDELGSAASCAMDQQSAHTGASSWGPRWEVVDEGWAVCLRWLLGEGSYADWSRGKGVSFWYRASAARQPVTFWMHIGDPGTTYEVAFETTTLSTLGWVRIEFPWEEFFLPSWEGEARDVFDPSRLNSYGFTVGAQGDPVSFELLVDDVALLRTGDQETAAAAEVWVYCGRDGESPVYIGAGQPLVLYWRWTTTSVQYLEDYMDAASFDLRLDGEPVDTVNASRTLWACEEGPCATWKLPSMTLGAGTHEVVMAVTLANAVLDGFDLDQDGNLDVYGPGEWVAPTCEIILH
jgi:hypothetical protein